MSKEIKVHPEVTSSPEVIRVANFLDLPESNIKELIDDYLKPKYQGFIELTLIKPSGAKISAMKGGQLCFLIWIYKNENDQLIRKEIISPGEISERRKVPIPEAGVGQTLLIKTEVGISYKLKITKITREAVLAKLDEGPEGRICILEIGEEGYFCKTKTGKIQSIKKVEG